MKNKKLLKQLDLRRKQILLTPDHVVAMWDKKLYDLQVKNNQPKFTPITDEMVDQLLGDITKVIL